MPLWGKEDKKRYSFGVRGTSKELRYGKESKKDMVKRVKRVKRVLSFFFRRDKKGLPLSFFLGTVKKNKGTGRAVFFLVRV